VGRYRALAATAVFLSLLFTIQPALDGLCIILSAYWAVNVLGVSNTMVVTGLNHDGLAEVLRRTDEGQVIVWTAGNQTLWEFRVETGWMTNIFAADLDRDGFDEVLVIAAVILPTNCMNVLRADGHPWWQRTLFGCPADGVHRKASVPTLFVSG